MSDLDKFLASVRRDACRAAAKVTAHRMKYGYEPRWEMDPDTRTLRILDCSLPGGKCPPAPPLDESGNAIAQIIREIEEGR